MGSLGAGYYCGQLGPEEGTLREQSLRQEENQKGEFQERGQSLSNVQKGQI